jgi:5-methylcytosine-specific restriction endonuclease McrA
MGAKPLHHTLSRKDPAKGFNPDNCFWKEGWFRPFESMYHRAKRETEERKSRGHKFELTYKEFLEFTCISACHYCGFDVGWKDCAKAPYNLDRKDNEGNYTKDNCVVCCFECNATKGSRFTYEEMLIIGAAVREVKLARKAKYPMLQLVEGVRA